MLVSGDYESLADNSREFDKGAKPAFDRNFDIRELLSK